MLTFVALQAPVLLPLPPLLARLAPLPQSRDRQLRQAAQQLVELLNPPKPALSNGQERLEAMELVFGVLRGRCLEPECDCNSYRSGRQPGPCLQCGHFPARHEGCSRDRSTSASRVEGKVSSTELSTPSAQFLKVRRISAHSPPSRKVRILRDSEVEVCEELGAGSSATVSRGIVDGVEVAVKTLLPGIVSQFEFMREMTAMSEMLHPHVVRLFGVLPLSLGIVMELCAQGSLFHYLHRPSLELESSICRQLLLDCAAGLRALHVHGLVHRDVKSLNYLVTAGSRVKLADLGLAHASATSQAKGTLIYCAPEILSGATLNTFASDVYAFALVLWEVLFRCYSPCKSYQKPFGEFADIAFDFQLVVRVVSEELRPTFPKQVPEQYQNLASSCWTTASDDRPQMGFVCLELAQQLNNNTLL